MFRFLHAYNGVPAPVMLVRIGQYILGTESDAQAATLAALTINNHGSLCHARVLC
jgi:hypothetical protein